MTILSLEDLQTRSQFIREAAAQGCVYVVEGSEGFARVPSPRRDGKQVELMWTSRTEAVRWADALVLEPKITQMPLDVLLARHLPRLAEEERLAGLNWSDGPAEPEMKSTDLDQQIRRQLIAQLVDGANKSRQVWLLKAGEEPLTLVTRHPAGGEVLPVFADRAAAEAAAYGTWSHAAAVRVPLSEFVQRAILWCAENRFRIAPAYVPGPGLVEMHAWEMKAMLTGHMPVRSVA